MSHAALKIHKHSRLIGLFTVRILFIFQTTHLYVHFGCSINGRSGGVWGVNSLMFFFVFGDAQGVAHSLVGVNSSIPNAYCGGGVSALLLSPQ